MRGQSIVGRLKTTPNDMYCTPIWACEVMYKTLIRDGVITPCMKILEPCSGTGNLVKTGRDHGLRIRASDIQTEDYIVGKRGVDVFQYPDNFCDCVLTNPPYAGIVSSGMLDKMLRISKHRVILLLNLNFLESSSRKGLFEKGILRYVYVYRQRVTMYPYGQEEPKNGAQRLLLGLSLIKAIKETLRYAGWKRSRT